jgi:hypothetical protein
LPLEEMMTDELLLAAIQDTPQTFAKMPERFLTKAFCERAASQDCWTVNYTSEQYRTEAVYLAAVKQDSSFLKSIPEEHRTEEMYSAAVEQDGYALKTVPEELRTPEMCRAALRSSASNNYFSITRYFQKIIDWKTKVIMYFDVTRERIKKIEHKALRPLALSALLKDRPFKKGVTEEELEAKIEELRKEYGW